MEFVGEFWKVLPNALRDVVETGDDFGKNSVLRLVCRTWYCFAYLLILYLQNDLIKQKSFAMQWKLMT